MDSKKIGLFLKKLRKEKKLTQEQIAEIFGVSGRTVSRWETGTNMPDLSILIQIADYYNVDIKEILNGGRKSEIMDNELKETLLKVADYSEAEKKKSLQAGNIAFLLMFSICTLAIVIQLSLTIDLKIVIGETAAALLGGIAYITIMVHHGLWEIGSKEKTNFFTGRNYQYSMCRYFFDTLCILYFQKGAVVSQAVHLALLFFIGITVIGFIILRLLALFNRKKRLHKTI